MYITSVIYFDRVIFIHLNLYIKIMILNELSRVFTPKTPMKKPSFWNHLTFLKLNNCSEYAKF